MSEMAKKARAAMKSKADRLGASRPLERVDSADWTPAELLNADVKTGLRPVSKRQFKKGGKVTGEACKVRADRKPRKSGGRAITADSLINRNVKEANEKREGIKHIGGMKKGGRAGKSNGGGETMPLPVPRPKSLDAKPPVDKKKIEPGDAASRDLNRMMDIQRQEDAAQPRKAGGRSKKMGGGDLSPYQEAMTKAANRAGVPSDVISSVPMQSRFSKTAGLKKGGKAEKHTDEAMDKKLIKKMVKPSARTGKAIGGAFGEFLSPALMLANAVRGDDKNRGGKATRKGRNEGGGANHEGVPIKKIPIGVSGLSPADAEKWKKQTDTSGMGWRAGYKPNDVNGEAKKRGGRTGKADGGPKYTPEQEAATLRDQASALRKYGKSSDKDDKAAKMTAALMMAKMRAGRKAGGRTKGKTNINIVIAAGKPGQQGMGGMQPADAPMQPAGLPVPVPPPQGAQGGMPMPIPMPMPMPQGAPAGGPPGMPPMARKAGGRISKIAKSYKDMTAGSGSGEGRLQKTDIAKRQPKPGFQKGDNVFSGVGYPNAVLGATGGRTAKNKGGKVYRSYKDMDAGAGSGFGRLEKTEIQARKK